MSSVVSDKCTRCAPLHCVEICPVDAFFGGDRMVVIDPEQCVSCGNCEVVCPVSAIQEEDAPGMERWAAFNRKMCREWPNIQIAMVRGE